jgi:integrase
MTGFSFATHARRHAAYAILRQLEEPARTLAILSAATGLRIWESLGLQWQDIDTAASEITVRRTWLHGKVRKPKTEASEGSRTHARAPR